MSALRLAAAAALVAVAVLAGLLSADVRSWRASLAGGDAAYAVSPSRAEWSPETRLGGAAESLLGVHGDVAFRRALKLYRAATAVPARLDTQIDRQGELGVAERALTAQASSSDRARAAEARTLLGVLSFDSASAGTGVSQTDIALADFTDAVRADPQDEAAKFDLELLLRLIAPHGKRSGAGNSTGLGKTGQRGAAGAPGSGY